MADIGWVAVAAAGMMGVFAGLGMFTFSYGDGWSYFSNDPAACANCHVMQEHFDAWSNASHRHVATCNDCHLSPDPIGKWWTKADNGLLHTLAFTTGIYPDPIRIKPRNRRVTQRACLHCHQGFVHALLPPDRGGDMLVCATCHATVGHAHR